MTLQMHPIALGCMLVVAVGTLIYTYVTTRQQAQQHSYGNTGPSHPGLNPIQGSPSSRTSSQSSLKGDNEQSRKRKETTDTCTICLGTMKNALKTLTCQHVFHSHCISTWLISHSSCPICRREAHI